MQSFCCIVTVYPSHEKIYVSSKIRLDMIKPNLIIPSTIKFVGRNSIYHFHEKIYVASKIRLDMIKPNLIIPSTIKFVGRNSMYGFFHGATKNQSNPTIPYGGV